MIMRALRRGGDVRPGPACPAAPCAAERDRQAAAGGRKTRVGAVRAVLRLADRPEQIESGRARTRFLFRSATLPALIAMPMIIPFRVPRDLIEVVLVPAIVTVIGIAWMQAGAGRISVVAAGAGARRVSIAYPLAAVLTLLLVFQILLRPGVPFY